MTKTYICIHEQSLVGTGSLEEIVYAAKAISPDIEPIVLEEESCKRIEFSWRGDAETVIAGLPGKADAATNKRGRPKLGVISKEVTLLPRHWEWLASQRGGASVTLRKLVDERMKNVSTEDLITIKQNQLYALMTLLGDESGFEEASRALYRNSKVSFEDAIKSWPADIKKIVMDKFNTLSDLHNGHK